MYTERFISGHQAANGRGKAMPVMKPIKLGLSMRYLGYHAAAWRHPDADPGAASKFDHFRRVAQTAEAAKFDMVFLADGIGIRGKDEPPGSLCRSAQNAELEPITLLSAHCRGDEPHRAGGDRVHHLQRAVPHRP